MSPRGASRLTAAKFPSHWMLRYRGDHYLTWGTHKPMIARPDQSSEPTSQRANDLFDSDELSRAVETEEFRRFLDRVPIAIVISKLIRGDQRAVYANKAFETLTGQACKDLVGHGWSILADYKKENDLQVTLQQTMLQHGSEEFLGTFQREQPRSVIVEAYSGLIQN